MQSQQDVNDSLFILIVNESNKYIFSKNLDHKSPIPNPQSPIPIKV